MGSKMCTALIILVSINITSTSEGFGLVWNKIQQLNALKSPCASNSYKLLSLLNLLCNATQTTNLTRRDACYGCFFRAGNQPSGPNQLAMLNDCANLYLNGTAYAQCTIGLALVANGTVQTTVSSSDICYTGYCNFVRCIRRLNSYTLIDTCFTENVLRYDLTSPAGRINFYTNVTSCILARSRCNSYNPISGMLQQPTVTQYGNTFGYEVFSQVPFNALQISAMGDLRIISFPTTIGIGDLFCSRATTLDQSAYQSLTC